MTEEYTIPETDLPTTHTEKVSIYMERSGKGSRKQSEKLLESPEHPLSLEEVNEARLYEASICDFPVEEGLSIEGLIKQRHSEAPRFFTEPFLKGLIHIDGLEGAIRQHRSSEDVYVWLAQAARDKTISPANLREMARQSAAYYKVEIQQALLRNERLPESTMESRGIVIEPEKSLRFARAAQVARNYLLGERVQYPATSRGVNGAKRAFVDIYTKKVNEMVAGDIVILGVLVKQSRLIGDDETVAEAYETIPDALHNAMNDSDEQARLYKRLDYIKHGIGYKEDGTASAVDDEVFDYTQENTNDEEQKPEVVFSKQERERLQEVTMTREEIHELFKVILADAGVLSAEDESSWSPGRGHRAEDNLFQVVYQPIKDTLAVNGIDGVVLTPNASRSIYEVITVGMHELTHINQVQSDSALSDFLRIGKLKGRRVSMLRETGANIAQRNLEKSLFGVSKPVAYAYARAIRELEAGGDVFDATKAFYEEKAGSVYNKGKVSAAKEAADRVLRLMSGRGTNSQPMSYAEENIMNRELAGASADVVQRATKITTLDLDDQLRLHAFGLLPEMDTKDIDWAPILMNRMAPIIESALEMGQES